MSAPTLETAPGDDCEVNGFGQVWFTPISINWDNLTSCYARL